MQKIYCYVDESGQDTEGAYFIVVVVILDQHSVNEIEKMIGKIERESPPIMVGDPIHDKNRRDPPNQGGIRAHLCAICKYSTNN